MSFPHPSEATSPTNCVLSGWDGIIMKDRKRILVVDDEVATLTLLRRVLSPEGYDIITSTSGTEALQLFQQEKPDIILLDVIIPQIDGLNVLRRIREQDPIVGIIMISALTSEKIARNAILFGANDYMTKPFTFHDLRSRIKEVLERTSLQRENVRLQEELDQANAKLKAIFERYMASPVAERLLALPGLPDLGGVRQTVSVLFMDLRNYTRLAEQLKPRQLMNILNRYLSEATEAIIATNGTVDKFMGDAVMALFNAPVEQPDHLLRAVKAAWTMRQRLLAISQELGEHAFDFGIGIHSGEAIVGNVGSPRLMNYTAIGDAVNIANRLQELAQNGQILISAETAKALGNSVVTAPWGRQRLHGREEETTILEIVGVQEERMQLT